MNKFTKWLFQHVKREYKISYIATGFMGNTYDAGTFKFKVSDNHLRKYKTDAHTYGFYINKDKLNKHFSVINGRQTFTAVYIQLKHNQ
tara:strand:- start:1415 stop:1678 length:264 start_codon:yes stop_codon:yes gene_type:complete